MSETESTNETDDAVFEGDETTAAETTVKTESQRTSKRKNGTGTIAWLALLLAMIAVAGVGYDFLQDWNSAGDVEESNTQVRTLASSVNSSRNALQSLDDRVSALVELDSTRASEFERLGRQLDDRLRRMEALPSRMSAVEASMSSIQGISAGARDAWLIAEAEYYLQIANAQLQLAGNPELASIALTHADGRILQLGDPRLTGVRRALSDELQALEVMEKPDIAGITLTLGSLATIVDSLPLRHEAIAQGESSSSEIDPDLTGVDRAMASVKNALSGVVSVRRTDEAMQPLIAPEAQYFLRQNLSLQLQAARLAMLRGEETVFRQSLDDAGAWLNEYYDPASTAVQSAKATISEIRGSVFNVAMPDISRSLRLLRQYNALSDAGPVNDTTEENNTQTIDEQEEPEVVEEAGPDDEQEEPEVTDKAEPE